MGSSSSWGRSSFRRTLGPGSEEPQYWVVVHPDNPSITLRRDEVSRLFLKKITRWSNGQTAAPVDLVAVVPGARGLFPGRPPAVRIGDQEILAADGVHRPIRAPA